MPDASLLTPDSQVKENMIKMQSKEIMKVTRIAAAKAANNIASVSVTH